MGQVRIGNHGCVSIRDVIQGTFVLWMARKRLIIGGYSCNSWFELLFSDFLQLSEMRSVVTALMLCIKRISILKA